MDKIVSQQSAKLSVYVIAYNDEPNIRACLESVSWADELIVVDSYSTDATEKISREFTDKVYQHEFKGFGQLRNGMVLAKPSHDRTRRRRSAETSYWTVHELQHVTGSKPCLVLEGVGKQVVRAAANSAPSFATGSHGPGISYADPYELFSQIIADRACVCCGTR